MRACPVALKRLVGSMHSWFVADGDWNPFGWRRKLMLREESYLTLPVQMVLTQPLNCCCGHLHTTCYLFHIWYGCASVHTAVEHMQEAVCSQAGTWFCTYIPEHKYWYCRPRGKRIVGVEGPPMFWPDSLVIKTLTELLGYLGSILSVLATQVWTYISSILEHSALAARPQVRH